jgi:hypothetical protein
VATLAPRPVMVAIAKSGTSIVPLILMASNTIPSPRRAQDR